MTLILEQAHDSVDRRPSIDRAHERQDRIDARRDARRSPHVAVDGPSRDGDPVDPRALGNDPFPRGLVGRRLLAVQDAGLGGERGARADGDEVVDRRIPCFDEHAELVERRAGNARAHAPGDDEDVECRRRLERVCWQDALVECRAHWVPGRYRGRGRNRVERCGDEGERELELERGEEVENV